MSRLSDQERAAFEAHIESLKEQIAWLRGQLAPAQASLQVPMLPMESRPWTTEEEEEVQELVDAGLIDSAEATRMLEGVGALNATIDFA